MYKLISFLFCVIHKNLNYYVCRPFRGPKTRHVALWLSPRSMAKEANRVRQGSAVVPEKENHCVLWCEPFTRACFSWHVRNQQSCHAERDWVRWTLFFLTFSSFQAALVKTFECCVDHSIKDWEPFQLGLGFLY